MKTAADYYEEGRALQKAGKPLPYVESMSWQRRALCDGYRQAAQEEEARDLGMYPAVHVPRVVVAHVESLLRSAQSNSCSEKRRLRLHRKVETLLARHGKSAPTPAP